MHRRVPPIPPCDVLFHCGDMSNRGEFSIYADLNRWLTTVPATHVVIVPGNHDTTFESDEDVSRHFFTRPNTTILIDQGAVVAGLKVWGSPVTKRFYDWAFNRDPGEDIQRHWDRIPPGLDVLVTHGPAMGHGSTVAGEDVGCPQLLETVVRAKPRIHAYGHIHEGAGTYTVKETGTISINAAFLDGRYRPRNPPVVIDL
jgi:Icc-related predicted phosphoesterase